MAGSPSSKHPTATAVAPEGAAEAPASSHSACPTEQTAARTPLTQSPALPFAVLTAAAGASAAEAPPTGEESSQHEQAAEPQDHVPAGAASSALQSSDAIAQVQGSQYVGASAIAQADEPPAAQQEVLSDGTHDNPASAAAQAGTPSALYTAAAAAAEEAEAGPSPAQLHSRGIIEGLLLSGAPWPDMDFEQLVQDAGEE